MNLTLSTQNYTVVYLKQTVFLKYMYTYVYNITAIL